MRAVDPPDQVRRVGNLPPPQRRSGRSISEASVGITVTVSSSAQPRAMLMVYASGANILPSMPCSEAIGRKTTMITATPKTIGRRTSAAAWRDQLATIAAGVATQQPHRVLDQHDRAVAEHADGDREARQGHQVRRHPERRP